MKIYRIRDWEIWYERSWRVWAAAKFGDINGRWTQKTSCCHRYKKSEIEAMIADRSIESAVDIYFE